MPTIETSSRLWLHPHELSGSNEQVTIEAPGREVIAVQMLRGIAATMVVFVHLDVQLPRLHHAPLGSFWLASGVDIFFVISGFIMWTSVERRAGLTAWGFLKNRIIRIVPLYWLVTTAVVLIALLAPKLLSSTALSAPHVIASYLFLPARHPVLTDHFWPLVVPGWSLNYEMLFYVIFAVAIALAGNSRLLRFGLIASLLALVLLLANLTKAEIDVMNFYGNPILLEFAMGVLLGIVWRTDVVRRSPFWIAALPAGFLLLWLPNHVGGGFVCTMLGATSIVAGAVFAPPLRANPLSSLGDASYSLYLTHTFALAAMTLVWNKLFPHLDWHLYVLSSLAAAFVVALLMYRYFELPATAALKRFSPQRVPTVPPVAAAGPDPLG